MDTDKPGDKSPGLYLRIADDLRERIADGTFGPGTRLPTESELAQEYGTTRPTVRAAYKVLIDEHLVELRKGYGYFVREVIRRVWHLGGPEGYVDAWEYMLEEQGSARSRETVSVRTHEASYPAQDTSFAALLDLQPDDLVARRSLTRVFDGAPVELTDILAPYARVKDSRFMSSGPVDVYDLLFPLTTPLDRSRDQIVCRNPSAAEKARLELSDASTVVEVLRVLWNDQEGPVCVVRSVYDAIGATFCTCTA